MKNGVFTCDKCLGQILKPEHGRLEWLVKAEGDRRVGHGLRLVHMDSYSPQTVDDWGCRYNADDERNRDGSTVNDASLKTCLGASGPKYLLEMLVDGELPTEDVLKMIRRLHVDDYEQERRQSR